VGDDQGGDVGALVQLDLAVDGGVELDVEEVCDRAFVLDFLVGREVGGDGSIEGASAGPSWE
jgi:hypothetical protein